MLQNLFFLFLNFKTGHEINFVKNFEKYSKMPRKKLQITYQLRFRSSH